MTKTPDESRANSGTRINTGREYWRIYDDDDDDATVARGDQLRAVHSIQSGGAPIYIDVYPQPDPDAPVLILNQDRPG